MGGWILNADPRTIINSGRWALLALAVLALARPGRGSSLPGRWTSAMMLAAFMLPVFVQAAPRWRVLFGPLNTGGATFRPGAGIDPGGFVDAAREPPIRSWCGSPSRCCALIWSRPEHAASSIGPTDTHPRAGR